MRKEFSIIGLGSLLSEDSARSTCPSLKDFKIVKVKGWRRIFNKMHSTLAVAGKIPNDSKEYACLSAIPAKDDIIYVSNFKIPTAEWPAFVSREFEYRLIEVPIVSEQENEAGIICAGNYDNDDQSYQACLADPLRIISWNKLKANYPNEPMWRNDILPYRPYVDKCLKILESQDSMILDNWLDTTYLGDNVTSLRSYLKL